MTSTKNKYRVVVYWSGYSRGGSEYIVEAESEEDAMENYDVGERTLHYTNRDDTESASLSATLIK